MLAYITLMSVLAVIGVYSQLGGLYFSSFILGGIPSLALVSAVFADNSKVFLDSKWRRNKQKLKKNGEQVLPAELTQVFTMLLIIGPMLSVALTPLGVFPSSFLLVGVAFIWIPSIAKAFLDGSSPDKLLANKSLKVSALVSLLLFIAAFV